MPGASQGLRPVGGGLQGSGPAFTGAPGHFPQAQLLPGHPALFLHLPPTWLQPCVLTHSGLSTCVYKVLSLDEEFQN